MEKLHTVRPLPLKIAGVIGLLAGAFYLAVVVDQGEGLGAALFWLALMAAASLLAWFADQFNGRRAAMISAGIFFILGIVSPLFFALVFLLAVILCFVGFVDLPLRG